MNLNRVFKDSEQGPLIGEGEGREMGAGTGKGRKALLYTEGVGCQWRGKQNVYPVHALIVTRSSLGRRQNKANH